MSEAKHTPGPLRAVFCPPDTDGDAGGYSIETLDGRRIAFVWGRSSYRVDGKPTGKMEFGSDYAEGDAALFVASLDLLEALQAVLKTLSLYFPNTDSPTTRKAKAAIAKAESCPK